MEKTVASNYVFRGKILNLRVDDVQLPGGRRATREVVEHPGAVGIVALTDEGQIVLIKQFRHATGKSLWEIPAGKLEIGEEPSQCAERELAEETGFTAGYWEKLTSFYTSPGFANEILHLYLARGLTTGKQSLDPDEFIHTYLLPLPEAVAKVNRGEICDAKTIIGILSAAHNEDGGTGKG